jgi:hypothetical protein
MTGSMVQVATAAERQFRPAEDTPAIAQDPYFRGAYDQWNGSSYGAPRTAEEERNLEDFGFSGRDPSRPGGEDPSLTPLTRHPSLHGSHAGLVILLVRKHQRRSKRGGVGVAT